VIRIQNIEFSYPKRKVLDKTCLEISDGAVFGILGPNGSGKTTLFRILTTLLLPESGSIEWLGNDLLKDAARVRRTLGVVFQYPSLDAQLTVEENLFCQGALYGLGGKDLAERIESRLKTLSVWDRRKEKVKTLSGGLKRRVELAKALLHDPQVLLLDEPSTGLDPRARVELWDFLIKLNQEKKITILVTTHLMEEAEKCSRLVIMDHGKVIAEGTPGDLKASVGAGRVFVGTSEQAAFSEMIQKRFQLASLPCDGGLQIEHPMPRDFVLDLIDAFPDRMHLFSVRQPSLEDVFLKKTGRSFEDEGMVQNVKK
jgi:ABC-2 type transport system ATP-binding protein